MDNSRKGKWKAYKPEGSTGYWNIDKFDTFSESTCYGDNAEENARRFAASANQLAFLPLELLEDPDYSVENELHYLDTQIIAEGKKSEAQRDELLAALKALYGWTKAEIEHFGATCPDDFIIEMVEKALADA